jgi:hypothetical protein
MSTLSRALVSTCFPSSPLQFAPPTPFFKAQPPGTSPIPIPATITLEYQYSSSRALPSICLDNNTRPFNNQHCRPPSPSFKGWRRAASPRLVARSSSSLPSPAAGCAASWAPPDPHNPAPLPPPPPHYLQPSCATGRSLRRPLAPAAGAAETAVMAAAARLPPLPAPLEGSAAPGTPREGEAAAGLRHGGGMRMQKVTRWRRRRRRRPCWMGGMWELGAPRGAGWTQVGGVTGLQPQHQPAAGLEQGRRGRRRQHCAVEIGLESHSEGEDAEEAHCQVKGLAAAAPAAAAPRRRAGRPASRRQSGGDAQQLPVVNGGKASTAGPAQAAAATEEDEVAAAEKLLPPDRLAAERPSESMSQRSNEQLLGALLSGDEVTAEHVTPRVRKRQAATMGERCARVCGASRSPRDAVGSRRSNLFACPLERCQVGPYMTWGGSGCPSPLSPRACAAVGLAWLHEL